MNKPRVTISKLIAVVAVVAVNLGVARAILASGMWFLLATAVTGLAIQIAIVRIVRGRGISRIFWSGFAACGFAAAASCVWAMTHNSSTGPSMAYRLWNPYVVFMAGHIRRLPHGHGMFDESGHPVLSGIAGTALLFLPQLVVALCGGLLALLIAKLMGKCEKRPEHGSTSPPLT